jgi:hypothetical protein
VISLKHGLSKLVGSQPELERPAMYEPVRGTWYVSRRVDAPAVVVTDLVRWLLADGPITVEADGSTLTVGPTDDAANLWTGHRGVTRAAEGRLGRSGCIGGFSRRVRVDLEVEAWSTGASELALRPSGRRPPGAATRYGEAAGLTLERLRDVVVRLLGAPDELAVGERLRRAS